MSFPTPDEIRKIQAQNIEQVKAAIKAGQDKIYTDLVIRAQDQLEHSTEFPVEFLYHYQSQFINWKVPVNEFITTLQSAGYKVSYDHSGIFNELKIKINV